MRYKIITYGCQMNVHESEKLKGILSEKGYSETDEMDNAAIILFNTCCIREGAENRALGNIGALKKRKKSEPELIIGVCGCMTQQDDAASKLIKRFPYIDIVFGTHNLHEFSRLLDERLAGSKRVVEIYDKEPCISEDVPVKRDGRQNAWVNIMYGCNNFCSYCIVPYVRGRERSRRKENILDEIRALIDEGYPEITLLGQNVNSYGSDFDGTGHFSELLSDISELPGSFRIKFMTSHPKDLSEEVIKVIASSHKLADYIHLPMQSGSNSVLRAMNRKYSREDYLAKIKMIRKYIPHCGLSSDFMVGFPGETEEDFLQTLDIIRQVKFDTIFSFIYSRRKGTPADLMPQIDEKIKRDRIYRLQELQDEIAYAQAESLVGTAMPALGESFADGKLSASSDTGRAIEIEDGEGYEGKFFDCMITSSKNSRLFGKIITSAKENNR